MNKIIISGNLTKAPDTRMTNNGTAVTTFTVAVKRPYKKDETDFIPVVAWRTTAENCGKYLNKGSKVGVCGSVQTRNYEAKDGSKKYITEIVADEVEFLDSKKEDKADISDFAETIDDSDLPF